MKPPASVLGQVGITEAVALAGALFGGISARQRKKEVEGAPGGARFSRSTHTIAERGASGLN